ncbi:MAG TPA: hypothetical protein VHM25_01225 [Polyangiaceae bacterium]|nr:hypothetical protein [Polyangiaceae bacterium]
MKNITAFRSASVLLFIFCLMHTGGGMLAQKSLGAASDTVFEAMKRTHFDFNGADCTWYGFWFGFGMTVSVFLLLVAVSALTLDRVTPETWPQVRPLAWALIAAMVANGIVAWRYFFAGPTIFSGLIVLLLIAGTMRKERRAPAPRVN